MAETMGEERALSIYKELVDHTRNVVKPLSVDKQVWYSRYIEEEDDWQQEKVDKKLQQGGGLGERMNQAFKEAFSGGYRKAVIIGSDCGELRTELVREAFQKLETGDVVLGPARDGGYYLLGMRSFYEALFEGIAWSTSRVFEQTVDKIRESGLRVHTLDMLNDVDSEEDWNKLKEDWDKL